MAFLCREGLNQLNLLLALVLKGPELLVLGLCPEPALICLFLQPLALTLLTLQGGLLLCHLGLHCLFDSLHSQEACFHLVSQVPDAGLLSFQGG